LDQAVKLMITTNTAFTLLGYYFIKFIGPLYLSRLQKCHDSAELEG